jgi:hypothetical protein
VGHIIGLDAVVMRSCTAGKRTQAIYPVARRYIDVSFCHGDGHIEYHLLGYDAVSCGIRNILPPSSGLTMRSGRPSPYKGRSYFTVPFLLPDLSKIPLRSKRSAYTACLRGLLFYPEEGISKIFRNAGKLIPDYTSHHIR